MNESKKIKKFKSQIITALPFFPNTKEIKQNLEEMHIRDIMLHYMHWRSRLLPDRPRKTQIASEVTSDKRWKIHRTAINALMKLASNGNDLQPYHSLKAHKEGYSPYVPEINDHHDSWKDKDFLLNAYGFYHLHLSQLIEKSGFSARTDDVLFCYANREMIRAVGIFNHNVFSDSKDEFGNLPSERNRLLSLSEKYESMGRKPGSVYLSNMLTTSGHPMHLSMAANNYFRYIRENDHHLNTRYFVNNLYNSANLTPPAKYDLSWGFFNLDFGIADNRNNRFITVYKGHI